MTRSLALVLSTILFAACGTEKPLPAVSDNRPNILLIVADDLGYSDLGVYGSEIETPIIDSLASSGTVLTNFYAAPTCSPSRAMLLTGIDSHRVGLGTMMERRTDVHVGRPGYEGQLRTDVLTIAERLRTTGYRTYMAGKWHLGHTAETNPAARGFDRSFALLDGGAFHMNSRPQANPVLSGIDVARYTEDGRPVALPDNYYSTQHFTDRLLTYIGDLSGRRKPFFAYLAFTAPHFPLQAPAESIARQAGRYDAGYEAIDTARLERMRALGVLSSSFSRPMLSASMPWRDLSTDAQAREARRMEVYAAMIADVDRHIGRVIDHLRARGELDNTYIFVLSDNGPEGRNVSQAIPSIGEWPERCCDNTIDNLGAANSFIWLGENWGRVSAAPFRGQKGNTTDGGLRVPAIVSHSGSDFAHRYSDAFVTIRDILPTILDIATVGIDTSAERVGPIPTGASLLPYLTGSSATVHDTDYTAAWELSGRRAVKRGSWKLVWDWDSFGLRDWALYDTARDPGERDDVREQQPEIFRELQSAWAAYVREQGVYVAPSPIEVQ
ncbi:MAG: arylsulfatase [Pseudomonadota bacterium]